MGEAAHSRKTSVQIGSVGMVTPVGLSSAASCAAMRAGISRLQQLPVANPLPEALIGAYVPTGTATGLSRLIRLLIPAVRECIEPIKRDELAMTPLIIGVAELDRPDRPPDIERELIAAVSRRLGVRFHPSLSQVIGEGRVSVMAALYLAREMIESRQVKRCIVAGVDSFINAIGLGWLYQNRRLKMEDNPDGLLPGEAAAAIEILPPNTSASAKRGGISIIGIGFGKEQATVMSGEPNLASGLTSAICNALAEAEMNLAEIDFRLSDVNGEQYYFKETANALLRILRQRKERFPIWHCADSIGDVGSAVGGVLLAIAAAAFRKRYADGSTVICQTSSDFGQRAAVILRADM